MGWTGAQTPEAAVKALGSLGIPSVSMVSGGVISAVRVEHVWVEAYVPYENYRGIGPGSGQKIWVPLDPSFKEYEKKQGLNIESITGITKESMTSSLLNSGEKSPDNLTVTSVNTSDLNNKIAETNDKLNNYITEKGLQNAKIEDIMGGSSIIQQSLGLLPLTLPYKTVTVTQELTTIPNNLTDAVGFAIKGSDPFGLNFSGVNDFDYNLSAPELFGKKITLSWKAASTEDESIISQYGGIFNTPAYLIQVKPQLKVDNEVVATGKAVGLGYRQEFVITMHSAGIPEENITNPVTAGAYYCVGLDYQTVSSNELTQIANKLKQVQPTVTKANIYNDEAMGEMLNGIAKSYFSQLDFVDKILSEEYKVKSTRLLSEAITGYNVKTSYVFMAPVEISEGGFFIYVDHDVVGVSSRTGKASDERSYMIASGMIASAMEHGIYEQALQTPSVSAIKILQQANNRGIPIYTITKNNLSTALSELEVSQQVKSDIQSAVYNGRIVTIPKSNIQYFDWNGTGYIVSDPATGAAAYMISGGIAGGSSSIAVDLASAVSMIIGVVMLIDAVCMLLAATTLIGGVIGFALAAFTLYYLTEVINQMYMYYILGDYEAGQQLIGEAILGIVCMVAGTVIGKIFEALGIDIGAIILSRVIKWLDDVGNGIATKLLDLGFSRESIMEIAEKKGVKGLDVVAEAIARIEAMDIYTVTTAELRTAVGGCVDETIETFMSKFGTSFKSNTLRIAYENEVNGLSEMATALRNQGYTEENIARTVSQARRDLGVTYKNASPPTLRDYIYDVNVNRYDGDPLGPTFDWLMDHYNGDYA